MLYLGIDQHRNQLTVDLGNEQGELVKHRQVSTMPKQLEAFLSWLREVSESEGGFAAIVEVCGFNDYLLKKYHKPQRTNAKADVVVPVMVFVFVYTAKKTFYRVRNSRNRKYSELTLLRLFCK